MSRCKVCRTRYEAKYFLQKTCFDPACLAQWSKSDKGGTTKKAKAIEDKENKKAVLELNRKSLKWQHDKTQPVFNKLRRLQEFKWFNDRGLEPTCISCGKEIGNDQWCNGHFKTVGSNSRLRYDFKNSYLQHNHQCNKQKSGDIDGYKKGLVNRFGDEARSIIDYCETNNSPIKYTWQELEELRKEFNKQIKGILVG